MKLNHDFPEKLKKLRFIKPQQQTRGKVPGALTFVGEQRQENVRLSVIVFDKEHFVEEELQHLDQIAEYQKNYENVWLNIDGLHDTELLKEVGKRFAVHPLIMEDVAHTGQRPKVYPLGEVIFFIVKMMHLEKKSTVLHAEQFSMILKSGILITFQEQVGDVFEPVRDRLRNDLGRIRKSKIDYLAYCLLDSIADNYMYLMEHLGAKVEELEDRILLSPDSDVLEAINRYKIELNYFRKAIRPTRDAMLNFKKLDTPLIHPSTQPFIDDLQDLISRVYDTLENYKSILSEQLTVYNANVTNRLNDIMKVLTIFSAIFIPLTFIAGIYGMNFDGDSSSLNMPELHWEYGYVTALGTMAFVGVALLVFFRIRKWI